MLSNKLNDNLIKKEEMLLDIIENEKPEMYDLFNDV